MVIFPFERVWSGKQVAECISEQCPPKGERVCSGKNDAGGFAADCSTFINIIL